MLSGRGDDRPDVGEDLRSLEGAEGAEIFIRSFIMRRSLFGLVVGEWDREVCDEAQDVIAVVTQAEEQVVAWPPGFSARVPGLLASGGWRSWKASPLARIAMYPVMISWRTGSGEFGLALVLSRAPELIGTMSNALISVAQALFRFLRWP